MRLYLETLEGRDMLDALLANAFVTYLAPQMVQTVNLMVQHETTLASAVVGMAETEGSVLGPQFLAANLPPVVNAAAALLSAAPSMSVAVISEIQADYYLLLSLPSQTGEVQFIRETALTMASLDSQFLAGF